MRAGWNTAKPGTQATNLCVWKECREGLIPMETAKPDLCHSQAMLVHGGLLLCYLENIMQSMILLLVVRPDPHRLVEL